MMAPPCINLIEHFNNKYRITLDVSAESADDPWMQVMQCRFGQIYPMGGDRLAVECDYKAMTAKKIESIPGITVWQYGDRERTFVFPVSLFSQVAAVIRPKRRRMMSEEQKAASVKRLAKYHDKSGKRLKTISLRTTSSKTFSNPGGI